MMKVILIRETPIQSVVADLLTFLMIMVCFWVNAIYLKSNSLDWLLGIILLISVVSLPIGRAYRETFTTKEAAIEAIKNL